MPVMNVPVHRMAKPTASERCVRTWPFSPVYSMAGMRNVDGTENHRWMLSA